MYKGILYGESTQEELGIVLRHPRKVHEPINATSSSSDQTAELSQSFLIKSKDLASIGSLVMDDVDNETSCGDEAQFGELYKLHEWEWDDKAVDNLISLDDDDASFSNTSCDQSTTNQPSFEVKQILDQESSTPFLDYTVYDHKELEIQQQASHKTHIYEEHAQLVEEHIMDEENGSSAVTRRAPADYFVNHKVQVFPATESDVIYHSIYMDESTIPTFAPSPITNHACAREKKKKKDEQSVTKIFRRCTRTLRAKRYHKKYAQKLKNKEQHLAELVNFHQAFKLDFPIPADIEPLLSKSKRSNSMPDDNDFERLYDSQQNTTTTSSITVKTTAIKKKSSFKFNVYADEFKPNPAIQELLASRNRAAPPLSSCTYHRSKLKKADTKHLSLYQVFKHPFYKTKAETPPNDIGPIWPFGMTQYNMQFMARTIENGNTYDRPFTTHLPYTCIQYQYPHVSQQAFV
ncbi:hypothetical protein LRAMOSA11460 [Lichtheimia ramosa]|uniref:Uncharacterized protein n=1 Tax=Lichtheimia ramosa TaxID=688394 RepID=A0A077WW07_9FUNG|nr:hypothetical protein LRAMOSA11460 [Lichtheimia ramosa]